MAWAHGEGVELYYETFGAPEDPPLLLIAGLGAQAIGWPDELCEGFVDRGFHVVRFDNRDVGLSTKLSEAVDLSALAGDVAAGRVPCGPYRLTDMALDAVAVLDAAGLDDVHLVGASMGGMIAQTMAIEHPSRVRTLTSIMSSTGEAHVGQPAPEVVELLAEPVATDREAAIAVALEWSRRVGSPDHADPD
ncbi:MAG: alpha/beta fold hydrolase, partial [Acidimicrobiia bacterium]|nr:alpha/beta fold hydrolase [Acidimicrobiia bacterium]